ncbi:MAG TPA: two-component regulator propeller domain-containing protein [Pyrinomonadaceae bacterium]|nr:two-component regulator propeller domain-containing protein [Pyrinomonadaceae bacterium]
MQNGFNCRLLSFFFLVFVCSPVSLIAKETLFKTWNTENGLPQNSVISIAQTPDGYIWLATFDGLTPTPDERSNTIAEFGTAPTAADAGARGRALLDVTQNPIFQQREMNPSFVQMEYFGYLRRNPNDAPDGNFAGYDFWLSKLNQFGNFQDAEMVKAFISSSEYRQRFGP